MTTTRTFLNTLNKGDRFTFNGQRDVMVVDSRFSEAGLTSLTYHPANGAFASHSMAAVGLMTVNVLV